MTPLHWASQHGHLPVVQALLDAGGDVRAQDIVSVSSWSSCTFCKLCSSIAVGGDLYKSTTNLRSQDQLCMYYRHIMYSEHYGHGMSKCQLPPCFLSLFWSGRFAFRLYMYLYMVRGSIK